MGINRNIVECKGRKFSTHPGSLRPVLIETLWNVKVNINDSIFFCMLRINRNIVECKDAEMGH